MSGAAVLPEDEAPQVLQRLAGLPQEGVVELPIAARYPLDRVADAFEDLE